MIQALMAIALAAVLVVGSLSRATFHQQRLKSMQIHHQAEALLDAMERYHHIPCFRYNGHQITAQP